RRTSSGPGIDNVDKLQILQRQRPRRDTTSLKITLPGPTRPAGGAYGAGQKERAMPIESRLAELGVTLPKVAESKGHYVSYKRVGPLLYISGQLCIGADGTIAEAHRGKIGSKITETEG